MRKLELFILVNGLLFTATLLYEAFHHRPARPASDYARKNSSTTIHLRQAKEVRLCDTTTLTRILCAYATSG